MIIVTGATGHYGSRVVEGLLQRLPAENIGVSVRDPAKASHLAERGVRVRRGDFADPDSLAEAFAGAAAETGQLIAPADGPVAWTTVEDLADAAVVASVEEGRLDGLTAPLTASEALDLAGVAAIASEVYGRPVERVVVSDDEWIARQGERGMPEGHARGLLTLFAASRRGELATVDPTLRAVLGHPTQTVHSVLAAQLQR